MALFEALGGLVGLGSSVAGALKSSKGFRVDEKLLREASDIAKKAGIPLEQAIVLAAEQAGLGRETAGLAREQADLVRASIDPTDKRFRNLAGLYEGLNRRASLTAIEDILRSNRRARARGDTSYGINPERRDEARTRAILDSFVRGREAANFRAAQGLSAGAQGLGGAGATMSRAGATVGGASGNVRAGGLGYTNIADVLINAATGGSAARQGQAGAIQNIGAAGGDIIAQLPEILAAFGGGSPSLVGNYNAGFT